MVAEHTQFEPLPMRRRELVPISSELYNIVSLRGESKEVKARTAYEAFKQSGFSVALRIERKVVTQRTAVLAKTSFAEAGTPTQDAAKGAFEPLPMRRKSPVVTADDLDSLMRALESTAAYMRQSESQANDQQQVMSPTGIDVHGDGFDEIIPAQLSTSEMGVVVQSEDGSISAEKPVEKALEKPPENPAMETTAEMVKEETKESASDQELTPEEVNKLLNG